MVIGIRKDLKIYLDIGDCLNIWEWRDMVHLFDSYLVQVWRFNDDYLDRYTLTTCLLSSLLLIGLITLLLGQFAGLYYRANDSPVTQET